MKKTTLATSFLISCLVLSGCSMVTKKPKGPNLVTGMLIKQEIDSYGNLICIYGALGSSNAGTFSGTPPKSINRCTDRAKINMYNNDITWIVKRAQNHIQYND
jgi:hypothetical protein